jgi:GTP pyrophosphokinase
MQQRGQNLERSLADITLAPYIVKAMALIGRCGKSGGNLFRHQILTMGVLLDYKYDDAVLLKAAVIHDLFEEASGMPGVSKEEIVAVDQDGPAVYDLVMEVTVRFREGKREPKSEYLTRVMRKGSERARILKLADRISNLMNLGFVHDPEFVKRVVSETKQYILPHAEQVNADMHREISDLVKDRERKLEFRRRAEDPDPPHAESALPHA